MLFSYVFAPAYDECAFIYESLLAYETGHIETITLKRAWTSAMWCAIPYSNPNYDFMACDVKIKLRVATPYHQAKEEFAITNPENDNLPMFSFSTEGLQAETHSTDVLVEALDIINIVPNPYYWGNHYGNNTYNDYVRIINLPQIVNISIYTSSGKLVNKFTKNNSSSFYQWDMKDKYGNLIQHGMYIFHIEVPGVGERVIKWFGSTSVFH